MTVIPDGEFFVHLLSHWALTYIRYLLENLPQEEYLNGDSLKKYLPWSEELPANIRNYEGEYDELKP